MVHTAGSNGGAREVTQAIDRDSVDSAIDAAVLAGVSRFVLVSVFPEAWRERILPDDENYYFAVKKQAEVTLVHSELQWLIVRPSLLTDESATGRVSLGPAELHEHISRHDVATTVAELLHQSQVRREIFELNRGDVPIVRAVAGTLRP